MEAAFGPARLGAVLLRPRRWLLSICLGLGLGLGLASGAAAQAPSESHASCATTLTEEPIAPIPPPPVADPNKLALGERLFTDPRLSAGGDLACSSCHDIHSNGAGGRKASVKPNVRASVAQDDARDKPKPRFDTLTIFNAALNFRLNWEGDVRTFAVQIESSLENPENMRTSVSEVVRKLNADHEIAEQFRVAYGQDPDRENFLDALVTFEQSLLTPGSRFDRWLGGDTSALSDKEQDGYRLFKSLGCISCHQGVNIGGNLLERQGIFRQLVPGKPTMVRVPSLRNVATTAPYFHDGSAPTLADAIRRMAAAQLDRTLSDQQIDSLVTFLQSLTGTFRGAPVSEARQ